jgi:3-methylcrotonyl-CoA carboxylase alpha subunit
VLVSNSSIGTEKDSLTDSQRFDLEYKVSGWWFGPDLLPEAFWLGNKIWVCDTASQIFDVPDPLDWVESLGTTADIIFSPMPGLVSNVAVMAGQKVEKDATLMVLEAMKMEHVLRAPCDCIVKEVLVASGDQVEAEATLILLENLGLSLSSGHC